jgi:hypothetical protein
MLHQSPRPRHVPKPWRLFLLCLSIAAIGVTHSTLAATEGHASGPGVLVKPGSIATTFEQLRVTVVADQLIKYLDGAVQWVDKPETNVPLASIVPKVLTAVLAHPEVRLSQEKRSTAAMATREAYAGFLPQLSANVETGNKRNAAVSTPWSSTPAYRDNSKALVVTGRQLLYDFGAVSKQVDAQQVLESAAARRWLEAADSRSPSLLG